MTDPDRFFLGAELPQDDLRFRVPARRGAKVTPLVDAKKAYGEMEKAIVAAHSTVHLCWWEFDPATPLISSAARKVGGGRSWIDLLEAKATGARGLAPAHVRMIIADSDPTFYGGQHAKTWAAFDFVASRRSGLSPAARARFEVIVGLHPALINFDDLGFLPKKLLTAAAELLLEAQRDHLNEIIEEAGSDGAAVATAVDDAKEEFRNRPGLWQNVLFDTATDRFKLVEPLSLSLRPASHHQKLCLVDGLIAFCGGLDIVPSRIDNSKHRAPAPWHDIQCKVEGAPVFDMERDFFRRWNVERGLFKTFVEAVNEIRPPLRVSHPDVKPMTAQAGAASLKRRPGSSRVQIIRTVSDVAPTGELLPNVIRQDIEESFLNAIANAERFVYLENQYMRWLPLADALVARHATTPIKVIVVVPTRPEEVRAPERDALTNHGMFLQNQFLQRLRAGLGADVGLFALAQKSAVSTPDPLDLFGSRQVYVHSKLMIVDDVFAMIGSANANGRGLFVDSELDIAWASPSAVRTFRLKLWAELLGGPTDLSSWRSELFVENWKFVAELNRSSPPALRLGFVVPNDPSAADAGVEFGLPEASKLI